MTFTDLAKELGVFHACLIIERIMHKYHNLFRRKPCEKPSLDAEQQTDRVRLARKGIQILHEAIIFKGDEMVEYNSAQRKNNQFQKRGSNPYLQADTKVQDKRTIRVMIWAAIANGFKSGLHIYKPEDIPSPEEQKENI